jgi:hypothetical protein
MKEEKTEVIYLNGKGASFKKRDQLPGLKTSSNWRFFDL